MLVALVGDLLGLGQQRLDLAQVKERVAVVGLLDYAGDDVALAARVLLVLHVALDLANALEDHLLGRLRGDPSEVGRRVVPLPDDGAVLIELLAVDADLPRLGVDGHDRLFGRVGPALVGGDQRVGERIEQGLDRNSLVPRDLPQRVEEFEVGLAHDLDRSLSCRLAPGFALDPRSGRPTGPHSKTVRALSIWS